MGFFRKQYSPNQLAKGLYSLCADDEIANASMQFYTKGKGQIDSNLHTKLKWHIYTLHLFICDYACFQKFGNSEVKNKILDAFYKQIADNLSAQPNDKQVTKAIVSEINAYGNAIRGKSLDNLLVSVGNVFANSIDEPSESLILMIAGSGIFTHFLITVNEWLDDVKLDYEQ